MNHQNYYSNINLTIYSSNSKVFIDAEGLFTDDDIHFIKGKIESLINYGNKNIVVNLNGVTCLTDKSAELFLYLLNIIKGKNGSFIFLAKSSIADKVFGKYRNIFTVFPNEKVMNAGNFIDNLKQRGIILSRKTGIRLSWPVAIFFFFIITGWYITLGFIISTQNKEILQQKEIINKHLIWRHKAEIEIRELKEKLAPIKQLGLIEDDVNTKKNAKKKKNKK